MAYLTNDVIECQSHLPSFWGVIALILLIEIMDIGPTNGIYFSLYDSLIYLEESFGLGTLKLEFEKPFYGVLGVGGRILLYFTCNYNLLYILCAIVISFQIGWTSLYFFL